MALNPSDASHGGVIARPTGNGRFQAEIALRGGNILADEPIDAGGGGTGPTPYELLAAALAACTAMTLKLYAERKGWALPPFSVEAAHAIVPAAGAERPRDLFTRRIAFEGPLDAAQEAKLLEIADKCPVHRTLVRGFEIVTRIGSGAALPPAEPATQHERDMEAVCRER
ncbi:MAG TPA: OsmC family protein [Allosphingosinicella sp.]|nr:OsmC family protein [Allosphingosinicella sp.]